MITLGTRAGHSILLDDDDWRLLEHTWHVVQTSARGILYAQTHISNHQTEYLHRLVAGARPGDGTIVDHINANGLDNRKLNLRIVNAQQSVWHTRSKRNYADTDLPKYKGVFKSGSTGKKKWTARIRTPDGRKSLGCYETPEEAAIAYDEAARVVQGEYAQLNFPIVVQ